MDGEHLSDADEDRRVAAARKSFLAGITRSPVERVQWSQDAIVFSSCNEDSRSELRAFGPLDGKSVLCITAGGGRVLNLLAARPARIVAVDLNPAQNHLLELKVAAMRTLDHAAYLRFLGVREDAARRATYRRLRSELPTSARNFFDAREHQIEAGILFQGRLERYLVRLSKILRLSHPLGARRVFECDRLDQQRAWLDRLDTAAFRAVAHTACRRSVLQTFSGDPGFFRYLPRSVPLHREIYRGFIEHFRNHLARENPLMQLIFFGRYIHEPALPPYLNAATYDQVRAALSQVELVTITATVDQAFEQAGPAAFDALSLSDISSYLDDDRHDHLFRMAFKAARPGAILCSRSNIRHRPLPPERVSKLLRNHPLEAELRIADHSCVHEFLIGQLG